MNRSWPYLMMLCGFMLMTVGLWKSPLSANQQEHRERWYQSDWCADHQGTMEVVLDDLTRVDCVTATHAVEFDFSQKWAEAIGQALQYGYMTGKKAGIVMIGTNSDHGVLHARQLIAVYSLPIDLWVVDP